MKITDIRVTPVTIPFKDVFAWRFGLRRNISCVIIQVETDEGIVGLGETDYLGPWMEELLRNITPLFIGENPFNIETLLSKVYEHGFVFWMESVAYPLCGIEMALWDIMGKALKVPLYSLFGGKFREDIPCVGYVGFLPPDKIGQAARKYVDQGFKTIKIKLGVSAKYDIECPQAVREAIGYAINLRADANQAWNPMTAISQIRKLEPLDIQYVEQPVPRWDLDGLKRVTNAVNVPIAVCEGNYNMYDAFKIIQKEAATILNVDPKRAGGLSCARKSFFLCEAAGYPVGFHGGAELSIANAAKVHLASATSNFMYAMDSLYHWCADDVVTEPLVYRNGALIPPEKPGIGMEVDEEKLEKYSQLFKENPVKGVWGLEDPGWKHGIPNY